MLRRQAAEGGDATTGGSTEDGLFIAVISSKRPHNVPRIEWKLFAGGAMRENVAWIVGAGEADAYGAAGARGRVVEGGALCKSRNLAIELAKKARCSHVVELSDDLKRVEVVRAGDSIAHFYDASLWRKPATLKQQNAVGSNKVEVSPVAAARLVVAVMRATGCKLGGAYVTANPGLACGMAPTTLCHFIVGDFAVLDVACPLRFDERFRLKEDYDLTAQHLRAYGRAARCNRVLCEFEHYTNRGGAVDVRTDSTEQHVIQLLHHKWPGCFRTHGTRGPNEVLLQWDRRDVSLGGTRAVDPTPLPEGCAVETQPPVDVVPPAETADGPRDTAADDDAGEHNDERPEAAGLPLLRGTTSERRDEDDLAAAAA